MSDQHNPINWFPGHMQKAIRLIEEKIKIIDIVIQIIDSRSIDISSNDDLIKQIAPHKKVIKIALKEDLAINVKRDENLIIGSIKNNNFRKLILKKINDASKSHIDSLVKKGIVKPKIYLIVLGLPNVGKSSFINFIAKKNELIAMDKPGVTKKNVWLKINDNIEMMDTPGILFKKIKNHETGYILTLLKCVKWDVVSKYDVIKFAYEFYTKKYKQYFHNFFEIDMYDDFQKFLELYCEKRKLYLPKNEYDFDVALEKLYKDFSSGDICKINYEK